MNNLDDLRINLDKAAFAIREATHITDYMREPRPDEIPDLIRRINARGWRIMLCQCISGPDWYVCMYRGEQSTISDMMPDPLMALQDALNRTAEHD